jgi:hypothetical protein
LYFSSDAYYSGNWCSESPILLWLFIQSGFYISFMIKAGLVLFLSYLPPPDTPRRIRFKFGLDVFYTFLVNILYAAWFIFGNTFLYTYPASKCRTATNESRQLWILMLVNLCLGYAALGSILIIGINLLCFVCLNDEEETDYRRIIGDQNGFILRMILGRQVSSWR